MHNTIICLYYKYLLTIQHQCVRYYECSGMNHFTFIEPLVEETKPKATKGVSGKKGGGKAKAAGKAPKRSVMVMLVTGEEKGLLGSQYYTEYPVFPLAKTVANINVDMVGRVDEKYKDNPDYVYVIGSDRLSTELHEINENANKKYTNLTLDYTYNAEDDPNRYYYRSDHYNFAVKGIPAVFYFNGTHEDYHRTTDTVEKINFEKMEKIGKLVFHTAWELADRKDKIKVDVVGKN